MEVRKDISYYLFGLPWCFGYSLKTKDAASNGGSIFIKKNLFVD